MTVGVSKTSNGRLRLEQGSNRRETLPKRVSEDSRRFIFRRRKILFDEISPGNFGFRRFGVVLDELRPNGPQNQLPRQILLQIDLS